MIRRIYDYPSQLLRDHRILGSSEPDICTPQFDPVSMEFFSPDFSRYLIPNNQTKDFTIKELETNKNIATVPKELMTFKEIEKAITVMNRMKWVDQRLLLIVNEEGFEKLVDIDNGFEEVSYNARPLFTSLNEKEYERCQYYF